MEKNDNTEGLEGLGGEGWITADHTWNSERMGLSLVVHTRINRTCEQKKCLHKKPSVCRRQEDHTWQSLTEAPHISSAQYQVWFAMEAPVSQSAHA